jgi:hypothetical protein
MTQGLSEQEINQIADDARSYAVSRSWRAITRTILSQAYSKGYKLSVVEKINETSDFVSISDELEIIENMMIEKLNMLHPWLEKEAFSSLVDQDVKSGYAYSLFKEILDSIWFEQKRVLVKSLDALGDAKPIPAGRYFAVIADVDGVRDENAIIGYDNALETYFCQAFEYEDDATGAQMKLWLGTSPNEYPTLTSMKKAIALRRFHLVSWDLEPEEVEGI